MIRTGPKAELPPPARASGLGLTRSIALVGLMGCGKTSVGRRMGELLEAPFIDADVEIEAAAAMSIPEIFEIHGEKEFRLGEKRVIKRLLQEPPFILATGGGAFIQDETRALLLENAAVIWLRAELDVLARRCAKRDNRPLLKTGDPRAILAGLIETRYPVYAQAHAVVDSRDGPHDLTAHAVIEAARALGALASKERRV